MIAVAIHGAPQRRPAPRLRMARASRLSSSGQRQDPTAARQRHQLVVSPSMSSNACVSTRPQRHSGIDLPRQCRLTSDDASIRCRFKGRTCDSRGAIGGSPTAPRPCRSSTAADSGGRPPLPSEPCNIDITNSDASDRLPGSPCCPAQPVRPLKMWMGLHTGGQGITCTIVHTHERFLTAGGKKLPRCGGDDPNTLLPAPLGAGVEPARRVSPRSVDSAACASNKCGTDCLCCLAQTVGGSQFVLMVVVQIAAQLTLSASSEDPLIGCCLNRCLASAHTYRGELAAGACAQHCGTQLPLGQPVKGSRRGLSRRSQERRGG